MDRTADTGGEFCRCRMSRESGANDGSGMPGRSTRILYRIGIRKGSRIGRSIGAGDVCAR